ncbi:hypothetical protein FACS1894200_05930 [Spirochaetia bacterium]|nr:hypothetical protein FACS1894200_01200 [Spirochaetia bacterium]GHU48588.1 hypothetical protein FACS1894200_05930 [Spirochaetia bacterium]
MKSNAPFSFLIPHTLLYPRRFLYLRLQGFLYPLRRVAVLLHRRTAEPPHLTGVTPLRYPNRKALPKESVLYTYLAAYDGFGSPSAFTS